MKNSKNWMIALFTAFILLMGCSHSEEAKMDDTKLQIVTSMFPMYEIVREVAGDRADISIMVNPNEDAHHYEPSAQAVASVNEADIFIYSSDEMEFWVESLLAVVENDDLQVIELGEGIDFTLGSEPTEEESQRVDEHGHNHGVLDPHFWLNPVAVDSQLHLIVESLTAKDPAGRKDYKKQATDFSNELLILDQAYRQAFDGAKNRAFVVQHQAFGHLADQYDLMQVAVGGLTTEVEPNPKQLAAIVDFVREQEVPVIYYQSGENSAIADTIADETGTRIGVLHDLERGPTDFSKESNQYIEAMYENLEQLQKSIH